MSLDFKKVLKNFNNNCNKLSYSKFKLFKNCELSWFTSNFVDATIHEVDQTFALPGIIVQRIFEEIINKKLYKTLDSVEFNAWIKDNVFSLINICTFPIEDQANPQPLNLESIDSIKKEYPLFSITSGLYKIYVNKKLLLKNFESLNSYAYFLYDLISENTLTFNKTLGLNINQTISEYYLKYKFGDIDVSGRVDFLEKDFTKENYFIFDGKMKLNSFVDNDQLTFYAFLINKMFGTIPYKAGFYSWTDKVFKPVNIDVDSFHNLELSLDSYSKRVEDLTKKLNVINSDVLTIDMLYELFSNSPSFTNCKFCVFKNSCKFSK